jgi:outer membrane protein TolC
VATLQIEQMVAAVDLIEALGGGWGRSQLPSPSQVSKKPSGGDYKLQH